MSRLVGYFNLELGQTDIDLVQAQLTKNLNINQSAPAIISTSAFAAGHTTFKHMQPQTGYAQDTDQGLRVLLLGRVDNRDEFNFSDDLTNSQLLLNEYLASPNDALAKFKGDFAGFIFNSRNNKLILFRDKIGVVPLYYSIQNKSIIFSTEIKSILNLMPNPPSAEPQGLSDYIDGGDLSIRDDLTCFKNIYSVLPAHAVSLDNFTPVCERYWDFKLTSTAPPRQFAEAREQFKKLFKQAVQRRIRYASTPCVSVSGGLDSSAIFCQSFALNSQTKAYSYVSSLIASDESKFLGDIEQKLNTQITRVKISDHVSVANTVAEQVQIAEAPFVDYLWSITSQFETHLSEDGCDVMMSGHWGDQIFFDWGYLVDDLRKFKFRRVFTHLNEYNTWYQEDVRNFIRKQIARELAKIILPIWFVKYYKAFNLYNMKRKSKWLEVRAIDVDQNEFYSQVPSLKSANRDPATEQAKSLYKQVRSRYHVHCLDWNYKVAGHYGLEFSFPILDVDLVQFMITLPGHLQNHLGVPRAILREAMRDLLPQSIADRTWKADFSDFVHDAIRNEVPDIIQTLGTAPACVTHKILNLDSLSKIISTAKRVVNENENTVSWRLFDILGLELWSKYFLNYYKKETQNEIRKENHEEVEINL